MYSTSSLAFLEDKIVLKDYPHYEVMMDWEVNIMSASSALACENGGDILEIGFGMGISANYIQQHDIKTHTIVESHPQILDILHNWAKNKPNVNIIEGDWVKVVDQLSTYDGIFFDTYADENATDFHLILDKIVNKGCNLTFWNGAKNKTNMLGISGVEYIEMSVNPPSNSYFNENTYYLPLKKY
jgi:protein arginine N-methyltransferase 2